MAINTENLEELIINPTLQHMGDKFNTSAARQLLLMTAAAESDMGTYLKQGLETVSDGRARARGIYMMEPDTLLDTWKRFNWAKCTFSRTLTMPKINSLVSNLKYATIMARAKYYLVPITLPQFGDMCPSGEHV